MNVATERPSSRRMKATTPLESTPPDRKHPSGTSLMRWSSIVLASSSRSRSFASSYVQSMRGESASFQ